MAEEQQFAWPWVGEWQPDPWAWIKPKAMERPRWKEPTWGAYQPGQITATGQFGPKEYLQGLYRYLTMQVSTGKMEVGDADNIGRLAVQYLNQNIWGVALPLWNELYEETTGYEYGQQPILSREEERGLQFWPIEKWYMEQQLKAQQTQQMPTWAYERGTQQSIEAGRVPGQPKFPTWYPVEERREEVELENQISQYTGESSEQLHGRYLSETGQGE